MEIISFFYSIGSLINFYLYKFKLKKTKKTPGIVISVGNITAGGTGKTSFVMKLAQILKDKKPSIITRGYKGKTKGPEEVKLEENSVEKFGDEAVMMKKALFNIPVVVSKKRIDGMKYAKESFGAEIFILDDAYQNHSVKKDLEILLIDALNPWGVLRREFKNAVRRADIIFITRANLCEEKKLKNLKNEISKISGKEVFPCELLIKEFENLKTGEKKDKTFFCNREVSAFCGIGNPLSFKALLEKNNIKVKKFFKFSDHFSYSEKYLEKFKDSVYLTTEKDAVKIRKFAGENIFSVKTEVKFDENIVKNFLQV